MSMPVQICKIVVSLSTKQYLTMSEAVPHQDSQPRSSMQICSYTSHAQPAYGVFADKIQADLVPEQIPALSQDNKRDQLLKYQKAITRHAYFTCALAE